MAHKAAQGSTKNNRDSQPKYLGTKLYAGEKAQPGSVIIRQRGSKILAGKNTAFGKDHTIYATKNGIVSFGTKRKTHFDGKVMVKKIVNVQ